MTRTLYILTFLILAGCSQAERADIQKQGQVVLPEYGSQDNRPLSLTQVSGNFNFIGSLILWGSDVTPDQILRMAENSRDARIIKSEMVNAKEGIYEARHEVVAAEKALIKLNRDIEDAMARGDRDLGRVRSVLLPVVADWFEKRITELNHSGSINVSDRAHAEKMFSAYCEVKLWELALSPLATASFSGRPSPVAMCESYYTTRQYFQNSDLCADRSDGAPKNYFACLWQEGVFRSPLFLDKLDTTPCRPRANPDDFPSRGAAIKAWFLSGLLEKILADHQVIDGRGTYADEFVSQSWSGSPYIPELYSKELYSELKRCRIAFKRADLSSEQVIESDDLWKYGTFESLRFIVETQSVAGTTFQLLPSTGDQDLDKRNYSKLAHYINAFSVRNARNGQYLVSYSDAKFNQPEGLEIKALLDQTKAIEADPAFAEFVEARKRFVPQPTWELQSQMAGDIDLVKDRPADLEDAYQKDVYLRFVTNQSDSISAASTPGLAQLFNAFALNLNEKDGAMQVEVKFTDSMRSLTGCLDYAGTGGCPAVADQNAKVAFASGSGRLTVTSKLEQPGQVGFMNRVSSDLFPYFSQIDESVLSGSELVMEFDINRLNDNLDFFTGTTYIRDGSGKELYQGSQSGDNVSQRLSDLDKAK